jgi:hypothetical protein
MPPELTGGKNKKREWTVIEPNIHHSVMFEKGG